MSGSLSCSICSENYKNSDTIYTTSCGHVYHFGCMQQWKSRSTSCPECRTLNPTSHKIYLTFEDTDELAKAATLRTQLDESVVRMSEMQLKVDEWERSFLALHEQYMESEDKNRQLSETIKYQDIQNESRQKQIAERTKENTELKQMLKLYLKPEQELALRDEVASLKLGLDKTTVQLDKEIDSVRVLTERAAVLSETIANHEQCLAHTKEELAQTSKQLEKETQISKMLVKDKEKLQEKLKQQSDAINQYRMVERALQVKIEVLTKEMESKEREIEVIKGETGHVLTNVCSAAGEGDQTTRRLGELSVLLVKEKEAFSDLLMKKIGLEQRLEQSEEKVADLEKSNKRTEEMLQMNIEDLTIENERHAKALMDRDVECQQLLDRMRKMLSAETEALLRERIKSLKCKLDEAWSEVAAKGKLSTALAMEKMQVQAELELSKQTIQQLQAQHEENLNELKTKTDFLRTQHELLGKQTAATSEQHYSAANNIRLAMGSNNNAKIMHFPNGGERSAGGAGELRRMPDGPADWRRSMVNVADSVSSVSNHLAIGSNNNAKILHFPNGGERSAGGACELRRMPDGPADWRRSMVNVADSVSSVSDHSTFAENDTRTISIRDIPKNFMGGSLEEFVCRTATMLGLFCTAADIENVFCLSRKFDQRTTDRNSNLYTVVVTFKRLDLKIQFLTQKDKLKPHGIFMSEFADRAVYRLFQYARSLIALDFHVYCRNNCVFVKKNSMSQPMRIVRQEDVDELKKAVERDQLPPKVKVGKTKSAKNAAVGGPKTVQKCDDQFYALSD